MLICNDISYSLFCNSNELSNNRAFIKQLFDKFFDSGFITSTVQLQNIDINANNGSVTRLERPQLVNSKTNEIINIMPDRIDYIKGSTTSNLLNGNLTVNSLHVSDSLKGIDYIIEIMNLMDKKASRLALNVNYVSKKTYCDNGLKFNNFLSKKTVNTSSQRFEFIEQINEETINVIHEVQYSKNPFLIRKGNVDTHVKGELVHNDINTHQSNMSARFDATLISKFFKNALQINEDIIKDISNE